MKKIVNINLGGYPFTIDIDAYEKMEAYFASLEKYFADYENPHEIIFDIEVRMAELFKENTGEHAILSISDVDKAIKILGTPEDFSKENIDEEEIKKDKDEIKKDKDEDEYIRKGRSRRRENVEYRVGKKLFRDPDNKIIAGVCSGLANYFGVPDPVWIRLLFVILFFGTGIGLIVYIVLMIVIPQAKTTTDRMEMRGEPIDIDTIANSIEEEFNNITNQFQDFTESFKKKRKDRRNSRRKRRRY